MGMMKPCAAVLGLLAAAALPVVAADVPASSSELEVITVTAQKRSESEQTVPLSMTTFGAVALEQKAIATFFDYGTKVPNLAFAPTGDGVGTSRTISIRGISGDNVTGFYLDETPLPDSIDPRVLDIDHIEVLRGPQGTLYGARSMGGTVRIITKQPNLNTFEATVHGGFSKTAQTSDPNYTADGVVNIPLIQDRLAARVSAFYDRQAGYFKRSFCTDPATAGVDAGAGQTCRPLDSTGVTTLDNIGEVKNYGGAISLTFQLNDNVTITPRALRQKSTFNGFPMADVLSAPGNRIGYAYGPDYADFAPLPNAMRPSSLTQARWFDIAEGGYDDWGLYSVGVKWKTRFGEFVSSSAYFDRKVVETEDETDFVWAAIISNVGVPPSGGGITEIKSYQRFVQEVRFASELDGPLQFVVGGFYSDFHGRVPFNAYYPGAIIPGLDNNLGGQNNPEVADLIFKSDGNTKVQEPAVFGELSYEVTKALKVTGGLRWYKVKTTAEGYQLGLAVGGGPRIVDPLTSTSESGVNPKVQIDYRITPDHMVYAMAAKGFRPGGLVPSVPAGDPTPGAALNCLENLQAINPALSLDATRRFKSDSLWNYELGTKTAWLENRLTVNAAAFFIKWKDIQQQILLPCGFQYRANAGAAESKGAEIEVRGRATERLDFSFGMGYQRAKITEASATSPQQVGSPVYQVPEWTGNAGVNYSVPLNDTWKLISGVDYSYIGKSFSGNNNPVDPRERPSYHLVNARVALSRGPLEFAVVGKNLSDERANLGDSRSIAAETPGRPRLFVNQPRTIGVEVRASF
jgi:iron complex outermembrane recepter protein